MCSDPLKFTTGTHMYECTFTTGTQMYEYTFQVYQHITHTFARIPSIPSIPRIPGSTFAKHWLSNSFNPLRALAAGAGFLRAWVISCRKKEEAEGVLSRRFRLNKGTETGIREYEISETLATHTTRLKLKLMNIFGENQVPTNIR